VILLVKVTPDLRLRDATRDISLSVEEEMEAVQVTVNLEGGGPAMLEPVVALEGSD
jgi:hypothetical protein